MMATLILNLDYFTIECIKILSNEFVNMICLVDFILNFNNNFNVILIFIQEKLLRVSIEAQGIRYPTNKTTFISYSSKLFSRILDFVFKSFTNHLYLSSFIVMKLLYFLSVIKSKQFLDIRYLTTYFYLRLYFYKKFKLKKLMLQDQ